MLDLICLLLLWLLVGYAVRDCIERNRRRRAPPAWHPVGLPPDRPAGPQIPAARPSPLVGLDELPPEDRQVLEEVIGCS